MGDNKNNLDVGLRNPPDEDDASAFLEGTSDEAETSEDSETSNQQEGTTSTSNGDQADANESKQCTFYLDSDVKQRLEHYCDQQGRTQSWTAEHAIKLFLDDEGY